MLTVVFEQIKNLPWMYALTSSYHLEVFLKGYIVGACIHKKDDVHLSIEFAKLSRYISFTLPFEGEVWGKYVRFISNSDQESLKKSLALFESFLNDDIEGVESILQINNCSFETHDVNDAQMLINKIEKNGAIYGLYSVSEIACFLYGYGLYCSNYSIVDKSSPLHIIGDADGFNNFLSKQYKLKFKQPYYDIIHYLIPMNQSEGISQFFLLYKIFTKKKL